MRERESERERVKPSPIKRSLSTDWKRQLNFFRKILNVNVVINWP